MRKLKMWVMFCDTRAYDIRCRTKRECWAEFEMAGYSKAELSNSGYSAPQRIEITYRGALDLVNEVLGEGSSYTPATAGGES